MTDERVSGYAQEPRQRLIGCASFRPRIQCAHPRVLNEIFGQAGVATDPPRDVGVERPDGVAIDANQVVFAKVGHRAHIYIDAREGSKPTKYFY